MPIANKGWKQEEIGNKQRGGLSKGHPLTKCGANAKPKEVHPQEIWDHILKDSWEHASVLVNLVGRVIIEP